jgi:hypothetical protein
MISLDCLPAEVLEIVIYFLDGHSILQLSCTCKLFHELTGNENLWKTLFNETYFDIEISERDILEQPRYFTYSTQSNNKLISNFEKRLKFFLSFTHI